MSIAPVHNVPGGTRGYCAPCALIAPCTTSPVGRGGTARRADAARPAHELACFGWFGGGQKDAGFDGSGRPVAQLALLPGVTHYNVLTSPALAPIVAAFLGES